MFSKSPQLKRQFFTAVGLPVLLLGLLLMIIFSSGRTATAAPTACPTNDFPDDTNSTHTLSGDIYVGENILIRNSMSVTIEAGSNIIFCDEYDIQVSNGGALVAMGTAANPITFQANDPNIPWGHLSLFDAHESTILRYVTLSDGGGDAADVDNSYRGTIEVDGNNASTAASPVINHVTITNSGTNGLYLETTTNDNTPAAVSNLTINNSAAAPIRMDLDSFGGLGEGNQYNNNTPDHIIVFSGGGSRVSHSQTWRNPGVPVEIEAGGIILASDIISQPAEITIEPGLTFLMHPDATLSVGTSLSRPASLYANGTISEPITFTRLSDVSAPWDKLWLQLYDNTEVKLNHVIMEFGGATLEAPPIDNGIIYGDGPLSIRNSVIRNSSSNGIYLRGNVATINNSVIENNQAYGLQTSFNVNGTILRGNTIRNNILGGIRVNNGDNSYCVDAIGNFWGDNNGPNDPAGEADACGNGRTNNGLGNSVSTGLRYVPSLTGDEDLQNRGTILPDPYYVIADGLDAAVLTVTLVDAVGNPLVGKQIELEATTGTITQPTAATDANGQTTAVISSDTPGFAYITAQNLTDNLPVAGIAGVTFWQGADFGGLISSSGAPYASPEFIVTGRPFQQGVPVGMRVPMQNSNPTSVDVTVVYGVTGINVGTRFTPVYTASQTLAPGESWDAAGVWLPDVSGHKCIQANIIIDDGTTTFDVLDIFGGNLQQNTDQDPCNPDALDPGKAIPKKPGGLFTVAKTFYKLYNLSKKANKCLNDSLNFYAFDGQETQQHDYETIATPPTFTPPAITAGGEITAAQADALNDLSQTSADLLALNLALGVTKQRMYYASIASRGYGGAALGARAYLDRQFEAYRDYTNQYADKLDLFADQI
ncbi:MAG: Ig-like domain-containing protein, partial [Anaerolineales bacterium]|nr:Ig-like domain-containing protein [Anaerolineales bacterium]